MLSFKLIGIYPEWNVKIKEAIKLKYKAIIGIYPEWNVKRKGGQRMILKINWNISRMECKVVPTKLYVRDSVIGIYPEWNVKRLEATYEEATFNWNISRMECKGKTGRAIFIKR